jgi:hypothetical protein
MVSSLRRKSRWLLRCLGFGSLAVFAGGAACGGGGSGHGSSGFTPGEDSGVADDSGGGDSSIEQDTGSGPDGTLGGPDSSGSSSGGGGSSGSSGGDAAFEFDGFAHLDGWSEASYCPDDDGDGWTVCGGDCNDHDSQINPCAFDTNDPTDPVGTDGIDNDCDGYIDNVITCESQLADGFDYTPVDHANAANICDNPLCPRLVQSKAIWYGPSPKNAQRVTAHMGTSGEFVPRTLPANPTGAPPALNPYLSFLSNGTAEDSTDTPGYATCPGTDFDTVFTNPMPLTAAQNTNPCGTGVDESTVSVHDYTELRMTITAPINAGSFSFDFAFFSEEFPVYICAGFNDTFLAIQYSQQFPSGDQIAYDANNHRINVNNSFFQDCNPCTTSACPGWQAGPPAVDIACPNGIARLAGTFYDVALGPSSAPPSSCNEKWSSGGTDWLTTTSPVQPGETFTLSWIVFDENDGILDSSIILDHFRWHSTTLASPVTAR